MILHADAQHLPFADQSVHCVVTSPPYWGLRSYGGYEMQSLFGSADDFAVSRKHPERWWSRIRWRASERGCVWSPNKRSWIGALGLEPTPELFIEHMVQVFREVWRVLRDDGTVWCNMGDAYASSPAGSPKDLVGIPWRMAFALQADGWYLRQDIIWHKPNPMPESVTDRCTKAHEYVFLLTKRPRYWYDAEGIKEPVSSDGAEKDYTDCPSKDREDGASDYRVYPSKWMTGKTITTRNRRSVWTIPTQACSEAHFATYPEALVIPCIKAGCPAQCCPECGKGWERVTESKRVPTCKCGRTDSEPGVVFDPFTGSGTTCIAALQLARRFVGTELNQAYIRIAHRRIHKVCGLLAAKMLVG